MLARRRSPRRRPRRGLVAEVGVSRHDDRHTGRAPVGRLAERLAQDLIEGDLRPLAEGGSGPDVHVDVDLARALELVGELAHGDLEVGVAQHDRLDGEREVAELLDDPRSRATAPWSSSTASVARPSRSAASAASCISAIPRATVAGRRGERPTAAAARPARP